MNSTRIITVGARILALGLTTAVGFGCSNDGNGPTGPIVDNRPKCDTTWVWETVHLTDTVCLGAGEVASVSDHVNRGDKANEMNDIRNISNRNLSKGGGNSAREVTTTDESSGCSVVLSAGIKEVVDTIFVECRTTAIKPDSPTNVRNGRNGS